MKSRWRKSIFVKKYFFQSSIRAKDWTLRTRPDKNDKTKMQWDQNGKNLSHPLCQDFDVAWSSGYRRRLMCWRWLVRIPAPSTGLNFHIDLFNVCLKKAEKMPGMAHFLNNRKRGAMKESWKEWNFDSKNGFFDAEAFSAESSFRSSIKKERKKTSCHHKGHRECHDGCDGAGFEGANNAKHCYAVFVWR